MPRLIALLRRYRTLLCLVCLSLLAAATVVQTLRLRYLEDRHARMFSDFAKAQLEFQFKAGELLQQLRGCQAPAPAPSTPP